MIIIMLLIRVISATKSIIIIYTENLFISIEASTMALPQESRTVQYVAFGRLFEGKIIHQL